MLDDSRTAMKTVKVDKARLKSTLTENRETHKREFGEAMSGYWDAFVGELTKMQEMVKAKDLNVEHSVRLARPVDHTTDYDEALAVLDWEKQDEILLSMNDFQCYVRDNWDWRDEFKGTHAAYSGGAGRRR